MELNKTETELLLVCISHIKKKLKPIHFMCEKPEKASPIAPDDNAELETC